MSYTRLLSHIVKLEEIRTFVMVRSDMKKLLYMLNSGKARFPNGVFRTSLNHVNSKVMPNRKHTEGLKRTKFKKKNSVNLFSDSGCSRQQIHSLTVSLSSLRTQSISSNF